MQSYIETNPWEIKISQTRTILPRLNFTKNLLTEILDGISNEKSSLSKHNKQNIVGLETYSESELELIQKEKLVYFTIHTLTQIQRQLDGLTHVDLIPQIIPTLIPTIRGISSMLHDRYPKHSFQLCEVSSILGSILMDSASITEACFDFKQSNLDSSILLDEAKLIVDSKLNKLYPNLDSFTGNNA